MAKKNSVPKRLQAKVKHEAKFIDMPKEQFIKECIIVAAVIVAIILAIVIWRANDGHLPVKDGAVVTGGDNWLVYNTGTTQKPRYFKLGSVGEVEGYTLEKDTAMTGDPNVPLQSYKPVAEDSKINSAYVMVGNGKYDELSTNATSSFLSYMPDFESTEMEDIEINGAKAKKFTFSYSMTEQPETDAEEDVKTIYVGGAYIYMEAGHDRCIITQVSSQNEDKEQMETAENLMAEAEKIASTITVG